MIKRSFRAFNKLVYLSGICTVGYYGYHASQYLKHQVNYKRHSNIEQLKFKYGNGFAVVTGSTHGIGLEFAREFARQGYNVCIIGRNKELINNQKIELEKDYNIKCESIVHDFSTTDTQHLQELESRLKNLNDISIVVNNVGAQYEFKKSFESLQPKDLINYLNVNILSQMLLYKYLITKLRNQKHRSLIIDVSSIVAESNVATDLAVYTCTKGFNLRFSRMIKAQFDAENIIRGEEKYNIDIANLKPGTVTTNFLNGEAGNNNLVCTASECVQTTLLDISNEIFETNGVLKHKFASLLLRIVPDEIQNRFFKYDAYKKRVIDNEGGVAPKK